MDSIYKILESMEQVEEKFDMKPTPKSERGKYAGKTAQELRKQYNALKDKEDKTQAEIEKMRELAFAVRAKTGWGKVNEERGEPESECCGAPLASYQKDTNLGRCRECGEMSEPAPEEQERMSNESKTTQDGSGPWYKEQRAKDAYEKANPGKRWADLPYGYKEDWRRKTESVEGDEMLEASGNDEGASVEDIASAITRRMMSMSNFGKIVREIDIIDLNDAIEDVAQFHEGGDLGSSDVSIMVKEVLKQLGVEHMNEDEVGEGNEFSGELAKARAAGAKEFEVDGKTYKVEEAAKPDFLDLDKDGDTKEPMKKAAKEKAMKEDYDKDEYDEEGEMVKSQARTIEDAARELQEILDDDENLPEWVQKKVTLAKEYIDTARDYMKANPDEEDGEEMDVELDEDAVEERKLSSSEKSEMERIVTAMKDDPETVKDMKERYGKRWKEVAYATATKMAKEHGKGTGNKKKKTESTTSGAVATSTDAGGTGIYGNPSIYESFNSKVENMITEGMQVNVSSGTEGEPSVNVSATGADAYALAQLLKLAAVPSRTAPCEVCGGMHEGSCMREENEANSADNTQTYDMQYLLNTISGGLNGPKRQINPNNKGDNPLAMTGLGKNTLNLEESDSVESHLQKLYKEFKGK